ncbi:MAG: hypothetical protein JJ864_15340 [Rhizobiaceae bacterium]|nr:hypothetical protein [Rhizobiaceae bacterium]
MMVVPAATASAARPDARKMTCDQTRALIHARGAAVVTTGAHTYERFVSSNRFCFHPEVKTPTYVSTKDTNQCPVFQCERPIRLFDD